MRLLCACFLLLALAPLLAQPVPTSPFEGAYKIGKDALQRGEYQTALAYLQTAVDEVGELPAGDPRALDVRFLLAQALYRLGRREDSEAALSTLLAERIKRHGLNSAEVADVYLGMGQYYLRTEGSARVGATFDSALSILRRLYGTQDHRVARALLTIAESYQMMGRNTEALAATEQALAILEQALGNTHADLLPTVQRLAALYQLHNKFPEALATYRRQLALTEAANGPDDAQTMQAVRTLMYFCRNQGFFVEAVPYYERYVTYLTRTPDDPASVIALTRDLGLLSAQAGYPDKAEAAYRENYRRGAASENPATALATARELGDFLLEQERAAEAEPLLQAAWAVAEKQASQAGTPHPGQTAAALARCYRAQGKLDAVTPLATAINTWVTADQKRYGSNGGIQTVMGYLALGNDAEAEKIYCRYLESLRRSPAPSQRPRIAETTIQLGLVLLRMKKADEATALFTQGLALTEQMTPQDHPALVTPLLHLAQGYSAQGKHTEAETACLRAWKLAETAFGPEARGNARILRRYAAVLRAAGKETDAATHEGRARAIEAKERE